MHPSTIPTAAACRRRHGALIKLLALAVACLLLPAHLAAAQRSAISATHIPSLVHSHSHPVRSTSIPQSATSSITTGTFTSATPSAVILPTHTLTINGTVTTLVGNATLNALAANTTATATSSTHLSPSPTLSEIPHAPPLPAHPPTPTTSKPNQNLHGTGDKSIDGTPPTPTPNPLTLGGLGGKYTVIAAASIGGLLMVMASAGAIGIRRSPRGLLPPRPAGATGPVDLVDQYVALERSPTWLAWVARGMPPCTHGQSRADAAIAYALGVRVDEVPRLRSEARWRAINGGCPQAHMPIKRESLARRVLRSTVMVSGWTAPFVGRASGAAAVVGKAKVVPVELARNGPVPPALEARELMRLRRRRSDAGKVSPWEPPVAGAAAVATSFQAMAGGRASPPPPPPLPPFPVSTRAAVMRVGSDRGSMDTELSDTYVAPRRKDLLPRHPTSAARPALFMPVTTDHIHHGLGSTSTSHASNRHSSSSTSSSSDPPASLQDVLDPAMIVAEYGAVRLSPPPTLADDLLPDGRPRARSLPAGMLRYAAYMAAQRHAARLRRDQLRAASRALGHVSSVTEDDLMSEGEHDEDDDQKQVVDGEGNPIVAPVYRLPANRAGARALVKQPSVSTMRRGSASTAMATSVCEPAGVAVRGRTMPATLAIPRGIDPDADTDVDAYLSSSPGVSQVGRSRATSVSFTCPLPPMPATMPLPPMSPATELDGYAHHEWHAVTPELAGAFPRRRASDVSTDLSSIIVVLDDDDDLLHHPRAASDYDEYELHEIVIGAPPALAHVRSVSSPVDAEWAVPAPGAAVAAAAGGYTERARSLSPPAGRAAARHAGPMPPPLVQLTRPWPAAHRR